MKNEKEVMLLTLARDIIAAPGAFTKGVFARGPDGYRCDWTNPGATCYCAVGALLKAEVELRLDHNDTYMRVAQKLNSVGNIGINGLDVFNDLPGTTQEDVVALFDKTIELFKADND